MIPVETGVGSPRREEFQTNGNNEKLREESEFLYEKCKQAMMRNATYKQRTIRCFDRWIKERRFKVGDLVLRKVFLNTKGFGPDMGRTIHGGRRVTKLAKL